MKIQIKNQIRGFSLIEMLVTIAVIGILAALVVPSLNNIKQSANDSSARRNAQNIASISAAAKADGGDHIESGSDPVDGLRISIGNLSQGVIGESNSTFQLSLAPEEVDEALAFLELRPTGAQDFAIIFVAP